jgi:arylsulfatase
MLVGLAPFQGIDVGIDRRSPVVWAVHERHGAFPYTGHLRSVTYVPGDPAPYDPDAVETALRKAGLAAQ